MEAQDSCKARGNRSEKSLEVVITWKNINRSRGLNSDYRFIAREILKNKYQIEVPDKAENRTGLRTEQEQAEWRPRSKSRDRLTETEDLEQ